MKTTIKSAIFTQYNKARSCGAFDARRCNRSIGILQHGQQRPYHTTITTCDCPDSLNGHICKHRIALAIAYRSFEQLCKTAYSIVINGKIIVDGEIFSSILDTATAHKIAQSRLTPRHVNGAIAYHYEGN